MPVRIFQWDQGDQGVLEGCYQVYLDAVGTDDPQGPRESARSFRLGLVQRETSEAVQTWVAADCGLTPLMLRRHFARRWGITPQAYRHRFTQLAG